MISSLGKSAIDNIYSNANYQYYTYTQYSHGNAYTDLKYLNISTTDSSKITLTLVPKK